MRASPESSAPARRAGDRPAGCLPQRLKPLSHAHGVSSLLASRGGDALGQVEQLGALVHLLEHRDRLLALARLAKCRSWAVMEPRHASRRLADHPAPNGLRARSSRLTLKWAATSPRMPASVPTRSASWAGTVDMVLAALCRRQAHVAP